ncbi:hypothetical protein [Comamonas sp. AG1104]|uniref:GapS6b family protein n=1 Tax=Comamonas sp. AG1104 TaxID=2183900 RepID=UPI000E2BBA4C|nr:hypothetical protein [Comamonas sp. AG1104]RDI10767.1 hypothetical protein DFO48_105280 [Comamonas sp. AG1104]
MSIINQTHSGSGDNVRDKIYIDIKSLAPDDLRAPMEMVFESLRKKDRPTAMIQMAVLKTIAQRDPENAALAEVISIYGELVEDDAHSSAWGTVSRIAASSRNEVVKDVCLAALLKLSYKSEREDAAKEYYIKESDPGPYAREAFLRLYASEADLDDAALAFYILEGELTGAVEGAFRLGLVELAERLAKRLDKEYKSYNSKVLLVMASAFALNNDVVKCHLWFSLPGVKQSVDTLTSRVVELLEISEGADERLYNMAFPIFITYQGLAPEGLTKTLNKYLTHLESINSEWAARLKAENGDYSSLEFWQRDLIGSKNNKQKRSLWCIDFLEKDNCTPESVVLFSRIATPSEIEEWLSRSVAIDGASAMESEFLRVLVYASFPGEKFEVFSERHTLDKHVEELLIKWSVDFSNINAALVFELAEKLLIAKLPHKALKLTSRLIPRHELWPSPFILSYLRILLESEQYNSFDELVNRVSESNSSPGLMNFKSLKAEKMGDISSSIQICEEAIALAPEVPYGWYRGSYLRIRFQDEIEQRAFHKRIPDSVLQNRSREVVAILSYLANAGDFKRAESIWVKWFVEDPKGCAVELVNFHLGQTMNGKEPFEVSPGLEQCLAAFQYEQDGKTVVRLIVDNNQESSEYTLKASSQLATLLQSSPLENRISLGMVSYEAIERIPPYVACVRIAMQLRHRQNDGSDSFAMLKLPSDSNEIISYLEDKFGRNSTRRQRNEILDVPIYMHGNFSYPRESLKAALNSWTDTRVSKSSFLALGNARAGAVVLDAYGIGFLALTDLAQDFLDIGVSFILPFSTREVLSDEVRRLSDEKFMTLDVDDNGRLVRTTALDLKNHSAHILSSLRLILENSSVAYPVSHDTPGDLYSVKDAVDHTVYDAMKLSFANDIPWLCMDSVFAALHHSKQYPLANVDSLVLQAGNIRPFDIEHKRHGLLLFAFKAIPLPISFSDIYHLAASTNTIAGYILDKIIQNHGSHIFVGSGRLVFLLDMICVHLQARIIADDNPWSAYAEYSPWKHYTEQIFNHGLRFFLMKYEGGTAEYRLAIAMKHIASECSFSPVLIRFIINKFVEFARGHFMNFDAFQENYRSIVSKGEGDLKSNNERAAIFSS